MKIPILNLRLEYEYMKEEIEAAIKKCKDAFKSVKLGYGYMRRS